MAKVIVYPPTSMILYDLVERMGHKALVVSEAVRNLVTASGIESPPLNVTPEEPKKGLRYAAVDVPSGVRGRMALIGPIIEEAEAAIIVEDPGWLTGCSGCSRTNELVRLLIRTKGIPLLDLSYPTNDDEAKVFVQKIRTFLEGLK
ncbi:MAG: methanogenesis marker 5 protein [Methanothrix sp.]|jgi:putative methanogenesis marker protein 5|nr:MAG: methanogenesis marker 5 protein [Methanothrix sp.]